jgi:acylphosphatase
VERRRVLVSGWVQGVWYRETCRRVAEDAGVTGYVRNLGDGRVEVVAEGPGPAVERLVAWCREGPPRAVVRQVEVQREDPEGLAGFSIR